MTTAGLVLYGPPASGKDTVTALLRDRLGEGVALFEKLKVGSGRQAGYRLSNHENVDQLRKKGLVVYENSRYGNCYVVDRPHLETMQAEGVIPIVHMAQLAGVRAMREESDGWLSVLLWCSRETCESRIQGRSENDVAERLSAWDETANDLSISTRTDFDLRIDTGMASMGDAADLIVDRIELPG